MREMREMSILQKMGSETADGKGQAEIVIMSLYCGRSEKEVAGAENTQHGRLGTKKPPGTEAGRQKLAGKTTMAEELPA